MAKKSVEQLGDQEISINRLHLDLGNYRHDPVASEAEAIAKLCNDEFVTELAKDVARRGSLSPLDLLGVIPMPGNPGHYVAVEGNRRTCALIVLNDPDRAPTKFRKQLARLSEEANFPTRVKAHVFASREDAKQWIDLRHLGDQGGVGTREWDATQKSRAAGGNTQTTARDNTLAVLVLDRLEEAGLLSPEQRKKVPVSTITRYLGTPEVRAMLGLHSLRELVYTHDADEVEAALQRLALDSITPDADGNCPVHSRSNSAARKQYANTLKAEGVSPTTLLDEPAPPSADSKQRPSRLDADSPKRRSPRDPDKRPNLIPTDFHITLKDPVLVRLRKEGRTLDVKEFTFSANFVLRAFIEQSITLFLRKRGKWRENMSDAALQQECAKELKAIGVQGKAVTLVEKAGGGRDQAYSLHSLGHVVHGGSVPSAEAVKRNFDSWRPALEAMLTYLADNTKQKKKV